MRKKDVAVATVTAVLVLAIGGLISWVLYTHGIKGLNKPIMQTLTGNNSQYAEEPATMPENAPKWDSEQTESYPAIAAHMKLQGRTMRDEDQITWLVQSGSAAEFTVTGTKAVLTLAGDGTALGKENHKPRYAVYLDDQLLTDALMRTKELEIPLFESNQPRTASVKVIQLSEAGYGAVGVKHVTVTSMYQEPVQPIPPKDLRIEFIGDSITCGYGVETKSEKDSFTTGTENFTKTYAYLTARMLNADYSAVCYSGYGIVSGWTGDGRKKPDSILPKYYNLIGILPKYKKQWDFEHAEQNDVVVINLGTNDYSYLSPSFSSRSKEFIKGYVDFLKQVRQKNPNAYIFCTMGTMGGESVYELIEQAVGEYSAATGDTRIKSYASPVQNQEDGYGADYHPSVKTQQDSAQLLTEEICNTLDIQPGGSFQ